MKKRFTYAHDGGHPGGPKSSGDHHHGDHQYSDHDGDHGSADTDG